MQYCPALRFLVKRENDGARGRLMNIFSFKHRTEVGLHADVSEDFRSSKNNFRGHDISQGLDREPPSLSPHFLLVLLNRRTATWNLFVKYAIVVVRFRTPLLGQQKGYS